MRRVKAAVMTATAVLVGVGCGDSIPVPFSVTVTPANSAISVGETVTLAATVRDDAGAVIPSSGLQWSSSSAGVATVANGTVTGVAPGTATITAQAGLSASGTATVTVLAGVFSVDVTPPTAALSPGQTVQLSANPKDAGGATVAGATVTWSSNNASVATVSTTGLVTAVADGSATITATSEGVTGTAAITVSSINIRINVENQLARPVDISVNGTALGQVAAAGFVDFMISQPDTLRLSWDLVRTETTGGTPIGDIVSASFGTLTVMVDDTLFFYTIDNVIGSDTIFTPRITNNSGVDLLMGVNIGLAEENRCNCVVPDGGSQVDIGYYRWVPGAIVQGFNTGSNYTGGSVGWTRPGMDPFLQSLDGIVLLVANNPPPVPPGRVRGAFMPPAAPSRIPAGGPPETLHAPARR